MLKRAFDIFYPPECPVCNQNISTAHTLCSSCWCKIDFITEPLCKKCGIPGEQEGYLQYLCSNQCNERKNSYLFSRSAVLYNQSVSYLIKQLKYHDNTIIVRMFVNWLIQAGKTMIDKCDFVIPVPIHKNKLKIRKYNQAALLGNLLSKRCNKIFVANLSTKIRDTENQSKLSKHQRMKNLKEVFCVKENLLRKISNKTVLLIDDVITTGSTTNECSNALLQNGVKKVLVLTVAKRLLV